MDITHVERLRQLQREKALYRYQLALEINDFEMVDSVLCEAESDVVLANMIFELNMAMADEDVTAAREVLTVEVRAAALIATMSDPALSADSLGEETPGDSYRHSTDASQFRTPDEYDADDLLANAGDFSPPVPSPLATGIPEAPWHSDRAYSPAVALALARATVLISKGSQQISSYLKAANCLVPMLSESMTSRQRLRTCTLLSMAMSAANEFPQAMKHIEDALDLAIALDDKHALVELLYLRAAICTVLLRFNDAAEDYTTAIELLHADDHKLPADANLEMEILSRSAGIEFYLARFDRTEQSLREARMLAPFTTDARFASASQELVHALLFRQRGMPELALRHAFAAAEEFASLDTPATAARAEVLLAELTLDLTAGFPAHAESIAFSALAQSHQARAASLAASAGDEGGMALAMNTNVRLSRLTNRDEDRMPIIEGLVRSASARNDIPLLAQFLCSLGDELAFQGFTEAALDRYRAVLDVLEYTDLPVLALPARRALLHAQEQRFLS